MLNHEGNTLESTSRTPRQAFPLIAAALAVGTLSACSDLSTHERVMFEDGQSTTSLTVQNPNDEKFEASDELYRLGVEQFNRGYYGNAVKYFQQAIVKSPKDAIAWISLAACYDQLRAFDLADRSYDYAVALGGKTSQLLNNQGYSYVLRGDLRKARKKFEEALKYDPNNVMAQNNLRRIESRERATQRARG
jgi:Flp pilus assembly protein TadD